MRNPYIKQLVAFLRSHVLMSLLIYGAAAGLLALALWVTFQFVKPLPPDKVTIVTGGESGAYYAFAARYAEFFHKHGFELEVRTSNGSMDNLSIIDDPKSGVQAAFMQGGIASPEEHPDLESLGSLYYEPVWLFTTRRFKPKTLTDLKGRKIAVGPEGSGTSHLVRQLLDANGVTPETANLLPQGSAQSVPELLGGRIDALFVIAGVNSKDVRTLCEAYKTVTPYSFVRAETYARTRHFLEKLTLPRGGVDLMLDLPAHDVALLAPTANLVVREDLHPALKYLFLLAAAEIHGQGDMFAATGEFPSDEALLFPLSDEARNFYKSGPPFLMRYLPFQAAITVERLKILLIPLLTLLFPLFKITPPAYRWQIRRRIFKWYKQLKRLDMEAFDLTDPDKARDMLAKLEEMDRLVLETSVPLSYTDYIYSLRLHIRMIRQRLERIAGHEVQDTGHPMN
ncbi:TAXI family TRAP transporter solute-binding subunit [Pseudodesulfovibrio thermohalotolerans]|uniref:TAXI family TRAP transporter solute-binding subunit n=1 Tax=Pseudodesulfovibrio thermohalotolerans TaxID=2880651 RepID=UPI0022B9E1CA|nr:TAXI family TRAP transporter solute-binding subunit [Pseudodesulfovibrio thermohalotolerans]WFS62879.1 TAXI family TRAP transporter solute-binding subunit [Pseudodesulfovibrio thermohalotolerans]